MVKNKLTLEPLDKNSLIFVVTKMNKLWLDLPAKRKHSLYELHEWLNNRHSNMRAHIVRNNKAPVAVVLLKNINWVNRHVWLEIMSDSESGLDEDITRAAIQEVRRLNLRKVSTDVILADHSTRISALEENGFKIEVRKRQGHFAKGVFKTVLEMALFLGTDYE